MVGSILLYAEVLNGLLSTPVFLAVEGFTE